MTNHAGLVGAEHVLTARTKTNRSRCHEISNQWHGTGKSASVHKEPIAALHESHRAETREHFVDETGLRECSEGWRHASRSRTTQGNQSPAVTRCRKESRQNEWGRIYVTN